MSLFDEIVAIYPELTTKDFDSMTGSIWLFDDSDGQGAYIAKWEYSQPLPEGMKVGK
jgi:hypothetical protein